jgi:hypothetical protein
MSAPIEAAFANPAKSPHSILFATSGRRRGPNGAKTMSKLIAIAFFLTVVVLSAPSPSLAYTQQDQMACQDDAFRLCGNFIPDEGRVKACLLRNMSRLSPACRRAFRRR